MENKIGNVTLNFDSYSGTDLYSEGENEDELLEIVQNHDESEFNQIIYRKHKWSVLYHLSHLRGNIVRSLPITKEHKVLEIGPGCGAITGTLSQMASYVECIELSKKRSLINAYRNKERDNILIHVGNFQDIEAHLDKSYDFITLIGVLEYGGSYISADEPYVVFLDTIRKHLAPGGKIIIAIENKYGLKYWAGCREDHTNKYFEGVEGYPSTQGVRTFSKRELEELLLKCGYEGLEFYYPYPDYKFANAIYSDEYLPKQGELSTNLRNFDGERILIFDETKVYDGLIKEQMFPFYSNSYLVLASGGGE